MRKKGLIGKTLAKIPPKPKAKKGPTLGPLGFRTEQRPQDAPHKL
jgi:hypothetical protein